MQAKFTLAMVTCSAAAIALGLAVAGAYQLVHERQATLRQLASVAKVVSAHSSAALSFRDEEAAAEALRAVAGVESVVGSALYASDGRLFHVWVRDRGGEMPATWRGGERAGAGGLHYVAEPVEAGGNTIGSVVLAHRDPAIAGQALRYLLIGAVILLLAVGFSIVISQLLQGALVEPLLRLTSAAQDVAVRQDYSLRVGKTSSDEVGLLTDSFNGMLEQLSVREAKLRDYQHHLESEVAVRTQELCTKNEQLCVAKEAAEAAAQAKSSFLASMSHEIRTPLNAVIGLTSLLLDRPLAAEERDYVETIRLSSDNLLTIINEILDFSKIEAHRMELESQPLDLRACVESAVDLVISQASKKPVELIHHVTADTPAMVLGDVTRLRQILVNLLGNAVKFTPRGEIILMATARRLDDGRHEIGFDVIDTGIGIPPDRIGNLFCAFTQADSSTTRRFGGTGLGLAISQRLVATMGGTITAESAPGRGSTFRVRIPMQAVEARPDDRAPGGASALAGRRVLVVDDNETNRRILSCKTAAWGMTSVLAASASQALDCLARQPRFDVVLANQDMPGQSGTELAEEIGRRMGADAPPILLLTSLGALARAGANPAVKACLSKPVKDGLLQAAMLEAFGLSPRRAASPAAPAEAPAEQHTLSQLRFLLVEDNHINQKVGLLMLQRLGCRADIAGNGLECLKAFEDRDYDVVLMDMMMPEMDGLEATRSLRENLPRERQPVVIGLSANAMPEDREKCLRAGMDDYLSKPLKLAELLGALQEWETGSMAGT